MPSSLSSSAPQVGLLFQLTQRCPVQPELWVKVSFHFTDHLSGDCEYEHAGSLVQSVQYCPSSLKLQYTAAISFILRTSQ